MRRIADRFGKLGFRHAFQVQRFARDRVVLFDDQSRKLMSEVGAFVGNLLVLTSQCATSFCPIRAAFLATRQPARGALDLSLGAPKETRVYSDAAVGVSGETIEPHINTDCRFSFNRRLGQIGEIEFNDQTDMPFASCAARECRALQRRVTGSRLSDGDPTNFRNIDAAIFEFNSLRDSERLMRAVFFFELRKARTFLKEVFKCSLTISESLLQKLRVDLFQPLEARLVFQFAQFNRKLRPGDGFASLFVAFLSARQRPVKDKPSRARITRERHLLFSGRIDPELVDFSFRHLISRSLRVDLSGNHLLGYGAVLSERRRVNGASQG